MATHDLPDVQRAFEGLIVPEGFRAELIDGEIVLSPSGSRLHWRLMRAMAKQFTPLEHWECVTEQTIRHPRFLDLPEPDLIVLPYSDEPDEDGDYHPADQVVFAAEVLSKNNAHNDEVKKAGLYARFGVPLYLIVDPFKGRCVLHLFPQGEVYTDQRLTAFGEPIELPSPLGFSLDTTVFRTYGERSARPTA